MTRHNRRSFLKTTTLAGTGLLAAPYGFWPSAEPADEQRRLGPNERRNVAIIGAGGRGAASLSALAATENIVALCDVDESRAATSYRKFAQVPKYPDFRVMLDKQRDIDAVVVATPD